jgi:hypothetical protein
MYQDYKNIVWSFQYNLIEKMKTKLTGGEGYSERHPVITEEGDTGADIWTGEPCVPERGVNNHTPICTSAEDASSLDHT